MNVRLSILLILLTPVLSVAQKQAVDEIRMSIYFGGGSYDIDEFQQQDLSNWLDSIPNLEHYEIQLISHTDPIGGIKHREA